MYLDYWQLAKKPFEPGTDRAQFFSSESHEAALLKLRYAVENRRGAAVLAGPAGVGKTMLVQLFRNELADSFRPQVNVVFPQMPGRDLLVYLAEQLGAPPADPPRHTIEESVRRLESVLQANAAKGRHAVLVIDEAPLDAGADAAKPVAPALSRFVHVVQRRFQFELHMFAQAVIHIRYRQFHFGFAVRMVANGGDVDFPVAIARRFRIVGHHRRAAECPGWRGNT